MPDIKFLELSECIIGIDYRSAILSLDNEHLHLDRRQTAIAPFCPVRSTRVLFRQPYSVLIRNNDIVFIRHPERELHAGNTACRRFGFLAYTYGSLADCKPCLQRSPVTAPIGCYDVFFVSGIRYSCGAGF